MPEEIELTVRPDGTVESVWWSEETMEYICLLCGKKCKKNPLQLMVCVNSNPYCG